MILTPIYKSQFDKDIKRVKKRGKALQKLKNIMVQLGKQRTLDRRFCDHPLKGEYADCRECHIEPDWLLIYLIQGNTITFIRTGSHADLFK